MGGRRFRLPALSITYVCRNSPTDVRERESRVAIWQPIRNQFRYRRVSVSYPDLGRTPTQDIGIG